MSETHACPICDEAVAHCERFPKQVCERCQSRTSDAYGRRLKFSGGLPGGLRAVYLDSGEEYTRRLCYIDGRKCFALEDGSGGGVIVETVKN